MMILPRTLSSLSKRTFCGWVALCIAGITMWVGPTSNRLSMNAFFIGGKVGLNASGNSGPGPSLSFRYEGGEPLLDGVRRHERRLREVKGRAYVYCTLNMYQTNPVPLQT